MKLEIKTSNTNTQIINSYIIKTRKSMENIIKEILIERQNKGYLITRTNSSYISEWKGHNRLYRLGLFKSHTKDVDLEENISKWKELIWLIIGI